MQTTAGVRPDCRLVMNTFFGARQSAVVGRQHSSRIGFSVPADVNSNVVHCYFHVSSLSRLLCSISSGSSIAAALL